MNQPCTVLISSDGKLSSIDIATLRADLESKDIQKKRNAVKSAIIQMSNGKDMSDLLMTVIRFCVTVDDHELTKLLHMYGSACWVMKYSYWECAQKCDDKGELKPEMILVCNAIMNNLKHANEFIRGCTLRFLSKITEEEILEPLVCPATSVSWRRCPTSRRTSSITPRTSERTRCSLGCHYSHTLRVVTPSTNSTAIVS